MDTAATTSTTDSTLVRTQLLARQVEDYGPRNPYFPVLYSLSFFGIILMKKSSALISFLLLSACAATTPDSQQDDAFDADVSDDDGTNNDDGSMTASVLKSPKIMDILGKID